MLDIVIVNWNAGLQLKECIDSIFNTDGCLVSNVIVVDNGSTDGSIENIEMIPDVKVIHAGGNLGFGKACNIGAKASAAPYILFLNPDTRLENNSLKVSFGFMESPQNKHVGICGIQLFDEEGVVSSTCSRFPTLSRLLISSLGVVKLPGFKSRGMRMGASEHNATKRVDQVMGAFFLIRRKAFEECEGFDERFFVYFEEVDLAKRAFLNGWESWYIYDAQAFHAGCGTSNQVKVHRLFYSLRSRLLYSFKHFSFWEAWLLVLITSVVEPFTRTAWCLFRRDFVGIKHTWSAYRMLWSNMKHIIRGEGRISS